MLDRLRMLLCVIKSKASEWTLLSQMPRIRELTVFADDSHRYRRTKWGATVWIKYHIMIRLYSADHSFLFDTKPHEIVIGW